MATYFLNANRLVRQDGSVVAPKLFVKSGDRVTWLNFSSADRLKVEAVHKAIRASRDNGSHWTIDLDALIAEAGIAENAISCTPTQVLAYATCVQNTIPDPVDEEFTKLLASKTVPVEDNPFS
jgi:hypothetical protein